MPQRSATLYRMKLSDHECPYGLLALRMLKDAGFAVDERILTTREDVETFKREHDVTTTPLIFIDGKRVGGSEELAACLGAVT